MGESRYVREGLLDCQVGATRLFRRMARIVYLDKDYINVQNTNNSFASFWIAAPSRAVVGFASRFRQVKNSDIARVSR